jgi:hypothetical protein
MRPRWDPRPEPPENLGMVNPYPNLQDDRWGQEHERGWHIPSLEAIPDVSLAINMALPFHPESGPMTVPKADG